MSKPYKVHVTICGTPAGAYEFDTLEEAQADMKERKKFEVLGCHYALQSPEGDAEAAYHTYAHEQAISHTQEYASYDIRAAFIAGYVKAVKEQP